MMTYGFLKCRLLQQLTSLCPFAMRAQQALVKLLAVASNNNK